MSIWTDFLRDSPAERRRGLGQLNTAFQPAEPVWSSERYNQTNSRTPIRQPLSKWYGYVPEKFAQFEAVYRDELATPPVQASLDHLRTLAKDDALTLLTATGDVDHGQPAVLVGLLQEPR